MDRHSTDSQNYNAFRAFADFAKKEGLALGDQSGIDTFVNQLGAALRKNAENAILVHGLRIQSMFAFVIAAMGDCKIISEEDAGEFFASSPKIKRPDFRVLTSEGQELFVEVKNFCRSNHEKEFSLETEYVSELDRYCNAFGKRNCKRKER